MWGNQLPNYVCYCDYYGVLEYLLTFPNNSVTVEKYGRVQPSFTNESLEQNLARDVPGDGNRTRVYACRAHRCICSARIRLG